MKPRLRYLSWRKRCFSNHPKAYFVIAVACSLLFVLPFQARSQAIVLQNDQLSVEFDNTTPSVKSYFFKKTGASITGDRNNETYVKIFYRDEFYFLPPATQSITQTTNFIIYHIRVVAFSETVNFDLTYSLSGNVLKLVFSNIIETPNCKLMEVGWINLVSVSGNQQGAKLVFPHFDGVLVDVPTTSRTTQAINSIFNGVVRPLQLAMLYYKDLLAVAYYKNLDMTLETTIYGDSVTDRSCSLRLNFVYRYASSSLPRVFVDTFDSEITSQEIDVAIVSDYDGDSDIDWMDGAKFFRSLLNITPYPPYLNSSIQWIIRAQPVHISKMMADISRVHNLIDGHEIIGYLIGSNTKILPAYTAVFGVPEDLDPDFASLQELISAFETGSKKYNTHLSFYDNYSNYCVQDPGYNPLYRIVMENGLPQPGWPYAGLECYSPDPYDYAVNVGLTRVKRTVERYPIEKSQLLDVLSLAFWNDFSPGSPASREKNYRGSKLIIDEFKKWGINVASEGLTSRFAGSGIGYFQHAPRKVGTHLELFTSAEPMPLLEFIYHGKTLYGPDGYYGVVPPEQVRMYEFLEPLLLGCAANSAIWSYLETSHPIYDYQIDRFYLVNLPWIALNRRFMTNYEAIGNYRKVTYDPYTYVEIDYDKNEYAVMVDGRIIGRNYTTFYPKDSNTFLIFSEKAKTITERLPRDWGDKVVLLKLTETGDNPQVSFSLSDNIFSFNAEANTPYKLIDISPPPKRTGRGLPWMMLLLGE